MLLKLAIRSLFRNTRRTAAILLTVAMGSGSIFIFHGFNAGIMNQYRENTVHSRYGYGQINERGYRDKVYEKPWEHWMEPMPDLEAKLRALPGVTYIFPRVEFFSLLTNGRITVSGRGQGVDGPNESKFFTTLNVEQGSNLDDAPDGILLGLGLARALDVKPGDRVTLLANTINGSMNGIDLRVTGIFHTGSKDFDDVVFRIPIQQARTLLDTQKYESLTLGLDSIKDWPAVANLVQKDFPKLEATPFAVLDKVYYQNSVDWLDSQFGVIQTIILAVVLLGMFNTVSTGILERKQEIGNLRANGDSVADVMALLLAEGAVSGVLGSIIGIAGATLITATLLRHGILMPPAPGLTRQFHVFIELQPRMAVIAFAMGTATVLVGTLLAGYRVAGMKIGEALRSL